MRRLISLALTALMIISMFSIGVFTTTASAADVGRVDAGYTPSGTPINTAEEFANISNGNYYLNADINIDALDSSDKEKLVGNLNVFTGILDGNGHTLTLSVPMFKDMENVTIKNMVLEGEIDYRSTEVDWHCGAIAQEGTNITIENVATYVDIIGYPTAKTIRTPNPVTGEEVVSYDSIYSGGLLGSVYGNITVKNCDNYGEISALVAGGLVGSIKKVPKAEEDTDGEYKKKETHTLFENCNNYGLITDEGCYDLIVQEADGTTVNKKQGIAGGIFAYGLATSFTFRNCKNTANVLSENTGTDGGPGSAMKENTTTGVLERDHAAEHTGGGVAGGIAGRILQSDSQNRCQVTFENCTNEGDVIGWSQIGGIGGWINCDVACYNCVNYGAVTSRANYAAGIIGRPGVDYYPSEITTIFEDCVNTGTITGHRQYAGGITSYSQDKTIVTRCLNTGLIQAEGVSATSQNPDGHLVAAAGIIVRIAQTADVSYCVNTGTIISNNYAAGILGSAGSGSIGGTNFTGGYNVLKGCLNIGDCYLYAKDNGIVNSEPITYEQLNTKTGEMETKVRYYYTPYNVGGILSYSYGSGNSNAQAPRIYGCGVTGNLTADWGCVCAFLGYTNTSYANIIGNYFSGELNGPDECVVPHQVQLHTDYQLEYCTAWIDRCDSQKFIDKNYILNGHQNKYMLLQNNGSEIPFTGYEYFFTKDDMESGKLTVLLNEITMYEFNEVLFFQDLTGVDGKYPNVPYYYMTMVGNAAGDIAEIKNHVVTDASGNYVNEVYYPAAKDTYERETDESTEEPNNVTTDPGDVTTEPIVTDPPETDPPAQSGGCGGVIGASVALLALALIAPAGVMLKKRDEE